MSTNSPVPLEAKRKDGETWKSLLAGGGAGVISKTSVSPFERVKLLCQNGKSTGLIATFCKIYREEGVLSFWRGNNANIVRVFPNRALLFWSNTFFKDALKQHAPNLNKHSVSILTGSCAGAAAVLSTYPLDLVRGRMGSLVGESKYTSMYRTVVITVQEESVFALFKGLAPTLVAAFPYEGLKFGAYDALKYFCPTSSDGSTPMIWSLSCGGFAGAIAGTITYPLDTIRRRMQMQGTEPGRVVYRHSIDCLVKMITVEGYTSLWAGVIANFWRVAPSVGIQFAAFEGLQGLLGLNRKQ